MKIDYGYVVPFVLFLIGYPIVKGTAKNIIEIGNYKFNYSLNHIIAAVIFVLIYLVFKFLKYKSQPNAKRSN